MPGSHVARRFASSRLAPRRDTLATRARVGHPAPHADGSVAHGVRAAWLIGLLLCAACGDEGVGPAPSSDGARNAAANPRTVLLVSLDTLRPGRLGAYGGSPEVAPVLDALAQQAVVFDDALAPAPWTLPSHMTMLSGLDPVAHDVRVEADVLSPDAVTLAEALQAQGFATGAFTDGGYVSGRYGFVQGFDVFDDDRASRPVHGMRHLAPRAAAWLEQQQGRDVFLFVHTFDAHEPYDSPPQDVLATFRARPTPDGPDDHGLHFVSHFEAQRRSQIPAYRRISELLNDYDAGVHVADAGVGVLLDALRATGRDDDALVIVTSDHGESFLDKGLHVGHGLLPSDAELHIPLVVRFPDGAGAGTHRSELVSLVDLAPTVLDVLGLDAPDDWQGESLRGLVEGRARRHDSVLGASRNLHLWYLAKGDWLFITPMGIDPIMVARAHLGPDTGEGTAFEFGPKDERVTLHYDTEGDPLGLRSLIPAEAQLHDRRRPDAQRSNLWDAQPDVVEHMTALFKEHMAESGELSRRLRKQKVDRSPGEERAQQRALAALGYVAVIDDADAPSSADVTKILAWQAPSPERDVDMTALLEGDRAVHRVRVLLADGGTAGEAERAALQAAGALYVDWLAEHPRLSPRIGFRLLECEQVARDAGVALDVDAWKRALLRDG